MYTLHTINRRKVKWIGHILGRNCLLRHIIEGKKEGRRERRRKLLLDGLKETTGYCKINKKALDSTLWRTRFGKTMDLTQDRLQGALTL